MLTVHKFPLEVTESQTVEIPEDHRILSVDFQHGKIAMWVLLDPESEPTDCQFEVYGTGHDIPHAPNLLRYIGTASQELSLGPVAWHVFQVSRRTVS